MICPMSRPDPLPPTPVTLTHWVRNYRLGTNEVTLVNGDEINLDAAMAFSFYKRLAQELGIVEFKMRIRLFDLHKAHLHAGRYFGRSINSFIAPASNEVCASRDLAILTADQDFADLMMEVWEKFQHPDGKILGFKEAEYLSYLQAVTAESAS